MRISKKSSTQYLANQLAVILDAWLEHDGCPPILAHQIGVLFAELFNAAQIVSPGVMDDTELRDGLPIALSVLTEQHRKRTPRPNIRLATKKIA